MATPAPDPRDPAFADTQYWVALLNERDMWHEQAVVVSQGITGRRIITTEAVLMELLASFSGMGARARMEAAGYVRDLQAHPEVEVVEQTHALFEAGLNLYEQRPDKKYSLADCISMQVMRNLGLREVLTNDHHFSQEGFRALLRE
jgi:uncharacterized protein